MLALLATIGMLACGGADQPPDPVLEKQRQVAETNIKTLAGAGMRSVETASLLVWSNLPEPKLKSLAAQFEKQFTTASAALQYEKDDRPWPGKLAVYLVPERQQFRSFVRQVEKRSPDDTEQGSQMLSGETPHIAVGPGRSASAAALETQAGHEIAAAVLTARMKAVPLPEWIVAGFSRAAAARAANQTPNVRKKAARDMIRARVRPREAWGEALTQDQRLTLATSIVDFLIFSGGVKPTQFLGGFRPDDQKSAKTVEDALSAVDLTIDQFEAAFVKWLATAK